MRTRSRLVGQAFQGTWDPLPLSIAFLGMISMAMIFHGLGQIGFTAVAHAQSQDPIVTSDSPEYCGVLMDRISGLTRAAAMPPPTEAAELSEEGERMCVHGQTRGGILRLRRALAIMRHGDD